MPKIQRRGLPRTLFQHLLDRMEKREISADQLVLLLDWLLLDWLLLEQEVPANKWFKHFPGLIVCGVGETIRTFLCIGQSPQVEEVI